VPTEVDAAVAHGAHEDARSGAVVEARLAGLDVDEHRDRAHQIRVVLRALDRARVE
jgi:hypothetical protein